MTTAKLAFAHYVPWFPRSISNTSPDYYQRSYLSPTGDASGTWGAYLRDCPDARPALTGDWKVTDVATEIDQARAAGIDGFMVDIAGDPYAAGQVWSIQQVEKVFAAGDQRPGFRLGIMFDLEGGSIRGLSPAGLAALTLTLAKHKSAMRLDDGRLVVAPYHAERGWTPTMWQQYADAMKSAGVPVALVFCFDDARNMTAYAPAAYGLGNWGNRSPGGNTIAGNVALAAKAHGLGRIWMQPVAVQDWRPRAGCWWEAANTLNLRQTFAGAIQGDADWIMLTTWNDYAENTQVAPSTRNRGAWLALMRHWVDWFKTGTEPVLAFADTPRLYVTHRPHFVADKPANGRQATFVNQGTPPQDVLEAVLITGRGGTLHLASGPSSSVLAIPGPGVHVATLPLQPGLQAASFTRKSATLASVASPTQVTHTPLWQDLTYLVAAG